MKDHLAQLASGQPLTAAQAEDAFEKIMTGRATPAEIGEVLKRIEAHGGATIDELVGAATVMRAKAVPVKAPPGARVIDTCGAGGTGSKMFNISTAAALVAAGAGRPHNLVVAKHGNRSITSASGSSQVLELLGVKIAASPATLARCLDEAGFCFCFAPAHHPAMKYAAAVRQELGIRTIFNLLGPLTNPAGAVAQVVGVPRADMTETFADALRRLGSDQAMVVHSILPGGGSIGELMTTGATTISHLRDGEIETYEVEPESLMIYRAEPADLCVDGPEKSAEVVRNVVTGQPGAARDVVLLNAAAGLVVGGLASDLPAGLLLAAEAIDNGNANRVLETVIEITQMDKT
jgi:anthranilate phosphoribosyltransferase